MEETGKLPQMTREAEERHLSEVIAIAAHNLEKNMAQEKSLREDIHELLETYGPKDKEALELIRSTKVLYEDVKRDRIRCEKARKKPYFGRIDFYDEESKKEETFYIGRVGIAKDIIEKAVIDWRAPIASVYYENAVGKCGYAVKNEKSYEIDLHRKRTYEIENDRLKDFYDSDVVANDELLTKYLAKNKKEALGEIIATIQKEQNEIIRKSPKQNVIVQGSAGSGKTTVAMHRISYILYNYEKEFLPEDFYIIGSNRILLDYITGVLPDLDVYGIRQMTMEQLFTRLLYEDWDAKKMKVRALKNEEDANHIKGTGFWFHALEEYCRKLENETIKQEDVYFEIPSKQKKTELLLMSAQSITAYIKEHPEVSVQNKIKMLNKRVMAKIQNEITGKQISYTDKDKKEIQNRYRLYFGPREWKQSIFELYTAFLKEQRLRGYAADIPEREFDVYDLAALAYLYKRVKETELIREASHAVIDEAQDFGMLVYSVLKYCMRGCTFTIMGDVSQNIHYGSGLNDWEELRKLFLTGPYDSFQLLRKSYRNTIEISDFAMRILRHGNFPVYPAEPIIRHGADVAVEQFLDETVLFDETAGQILRWQKMGYETIAVVCRDEPEAERVARILDRKGILTEHNPGKTQFGNGVMVLSVEYTKGLEFDAVLLFDPGSEKYPPDDAHVKLLYVAATRALHELAVFYGKTLTGLIAEPAPEREQKFFREKETEKKTKPKTQTKLKQKTKADSAVQREIRQQPFVLSGHHTSFLPGEKSRHQFGEIPDNSVLRPAGHGKIDTAVRWVEKRKSGVCCVSNYGVLHVGIVRKNIIRITFGAAEKIQTLFRDFKTDVKWSGRETREEIMLSTGKVHISIGKKTGAVSFSDSTGKILLKEKNNPPRQLDAVKKKNWMYFDWTKSEKIYAKGILKDDRLPLKNTAKYICYGKKSRRFPFVFSSLGYGIAAAADGSVLCCNIAMYGPYISTEGTDIIDYYLIAGSTENEVLETYIAFMNGAGTV